ncbi:hypothetical protein COA19_09835 [Bacillus thuringiensis]|uniref:hypothetical protein n=1 Tax=Bacillus thuringiensis TaxID=1428 RepID=UPI000BFCE263|nr:hypothetical protein [Bacillus thuringiensis]PGQ40766.1 hypothetical protein COA19_09835 [Bacillus thuringiensis]
MLKVKSLKFYFKKCVSKIVEFLLLASGPLLFITAFTGTFFVSFQSNPAIKDEAWIVLNVGVWTAIIGLVYDKLDIFYKEREAAQKKIDKQKKHIFQIIPGWYRNLKYITAFVFSIIGLAYCFFMNDELSKEAGTALMVGIFLNMLSNYLKNVGHRRYIKIINVLFLIAALLGVIFFESIYGSVLIGLDKKTAGILSKPFFDVLFMSFLIAMVKPFGGKVLNYNYNFSPLTVFFTIIISLIVIYEGYPNDTCIEIGGFLCLNSLGFISLRKYEGWQIRQMKKIQRALDKKFKVKWSWRFM